MMPIMVQKLTLISPTKNTLDGSANMIVGDLQLVLRFTLSMIWSRPIAVLTKTEWTAQTTAMIKVTHFVLILISQAQSIIAIIEKMNRVNNTTIWPNMVREFPALLP
jgi:hypothetical protein